MNLQEIIQRLLAGHNVSLRRNYPGGVYSILRYIPWGRDHDNKPHGVHYEVDTYIPGIGWGGGNAELTMAELLENAV